MVLAGLMPIVASIGGNTGNQSVALTIRGLALDQVDPRNAPFVMAKEMGVSLINGLIWGGVMALVTLVLYQDPVLGLIMGLTMLLDLILAAVVGVGIPLGPKTLGREPAMGSRIFLTFMTDAGGFFIFRGLAATLLPR